MADIIVNNNTDKLSFRSKPKQFLGAQPLRGNRATKSPSHGRDFFHFQLENVQSGAYLRRKFRLDDMYYMG